MENKNMVWLNKIIKENKESNSPLKYTECTFEVLYELEQQLSQLKQENENLRATIKNDDIATNNLCSEIRQLKQEKEELQDKLDKIEEYVNTNIKKINPKNLSNSELYMITPDTKIQRYYVCKDILQIIKGEDK